MYVFPLKSIFEPTILLSHPFFIALSVEKMLIFSTFNSESTYSFPKMPSETVSSPSVLLAIIQVPSSVTSGFMSPYRCFIENAQ